MATIANEANEANRARGVDSWDDLRRDAAARAATVGLPTRASEAWRYVDCAPLAHEPAAEAAPAITVLPGSTGWKSGPIEPALVRERWAKAVVDTTDIGQIWSWSQLRDTLHLHLPKGAQGHLHCRIETPGGWHGYRILISVDRGAVGSLVLEHALGAARACTGMDVDVAQGGSLTVEEIQSGADAAQLLSSAAISIDRDAQVTWTSAWRGGALVRAHQDVRLTASGASIDFAGLARVAGKRQAHQYLRVAHVVGDTRSRQLVKNVIDDTARASFDGLIHVAKGADRSDAEQLNHNLLLAPGGRADTRPQLDIHADEVKAAHGATVGRPEDEQITYLRTRGLDSETARTLVQQGFSDEILHRFRHVHP